MPFLLGILEQGLIISIAALGVYITYSILDFPDLSVDGTFSLGAAISIVLVLNNVNPFIAILLSMIVGSLAGLATGLLHVKLKITNLLSGILVMIGLYSINLRVMGKANISMFNKQSIFSDLNKFMAGSIWSKLVVILIITLVIKFIMDLLFKTKFGFILKATGDNETLVTTLGVNKGNIKILALMFSNALVGLSGGIMAQYQGFSDISMGTGLIIMALAAIILGQSIFRKEGVIKATTIVIIGAFLYKLSIGIVLKLGVTPTDVKLITSIIVILAIVLNNVKFVDTIKGKKVKRGVIDA
ncbi:putative ABC transport system permease protein [Clostridium cavendishii DSM 21758]|uniref:Putative ABC transport system permease protein n=1 Tax=Clostridium cavendishii DSM 21758 TaxID=1121302 RepID=A0A1M6SL66_9CLOT|nr:ABC transporter permease [Clostridium cavendishii]SHK45318.1 putative ABC transport system permease protein [Clostridium cavendishii DSM 21758]